MQFAEPCANLRDVRWGQCATRKTTSNTNFSVANLRRNGAGGVFGLGEYDYSGGQAVQAMAGKEVSVAVYLAMEEKERKARTLISYKKSCIDFPKQEISYSLYFSRNPFKNSGWKTFKK